MQPNITVLTNLMVCGHVIKMLVVAASHCVIQRPARMAILAVGHAAPSRVPILQISCGLGQRMGPCCSRAEEVKPSTADSSVFKRVDISGWGH